MSFLKLDMEDLRVVLRDLGSILLVIGYTLLLPLGVAYFYGEETLYPAFLYPSFIAMWLGIFLRWSFRGAMETLLRHAMLTAGIAWLLVSLIGAFPFMYSGISPLDSFFESMSGFTTTGMTLITEIDSMPKSLLFWRSMTQWIGGVGVIMLFLVVLVHSRIVIARFYLAEARKDRIRPAMSTTVSYIWRIYVSFTFLGIALYYIAGVGLFDSVTHTFSALSTGGLSTHTASIAYFGSIWVEAVTVLLMLMGGMSFVAHYRILTGKKSELLRNPEVKAYFVIVFLGSLLVSLNLITHHQYSPMQAFRYGIFQTVAVITTTGYSTKEIAQWPEFSKILFLFLMVSGANLGSTGGGFKVMRIVILIKHGYHEMIKNLLPGRAVVTLKLGDRTIEQEDVSRVTGLFFLFVTLLFGCGLIFSLLGYDALSAISLSASALSNVGPTFLPPQEWFAIPDPVKVVLIIEMWAGRLEIFPALALLVSLLSVITPKRPKKLLAPP